MNKNLKHIKYLLAALLILGLITLARAIFSEPPIDNHVDVIATSTNAIDKTTSSDKVKLVDFESLGKPFNPAELNATERQSLKILQISEDLSTYSDNSIFGESVPRVLKIAESEDTFIFTKSNGASADGGTETGSLSIANLKIAKYVSLDKTVLAEGEFYDTLRFDSGNSGAFNKYLINENGELVSIIQLVANENTFKNKTSCKRLAVLLKIDVNKNLLTVAKDTELPNSKNCSAITNRDGSIYMAEYDEALAKLNEK